jgi:hypothetical protein
VRCLTPVTRYEGLPAEWKHQNKQFGVSYEVCPLSCPLPPSLTRPSVSAKETSGWLQTEVTPPTLCLSRISLCLLILCLCSIPVVLTMLKKHLFDNNGHMVPPSSSSSLPHHSSSPLLVRRWEFSVSLLRKMSARYSIPTFSLLPLLCSFVTSPDIPPSLPLSLFPYSQRIKNQIDHGEYEGCTDVNVIANLIKVTTFPSHLSSALSLLSPLTPLLLLLRCSSESCL